MPNIKLIQQKLPKTFAILTKWRNFAKSGHTGDEDIFVTFAYTN